MRAQRQHGLRGPTSLTGRVEWDTSSIARSWALDPKVVALTVLAVLRRAE